MSEDRHKLDQKDSYENTAMYVLHQLCSFCLVHVQNSSESKGEISGEVECVIDCTARPHLGGMLPIHLDRCDGKSTEGPEIAACKAVGLSM